MDYYQKTQKLMQAINENGGLKREELPAVNYCAGHTYVRTLNVPKGVGLIGLIHKTDHVFGVLRGVIRIADAESSYIVDAREAPAFFVCKPGTQRTILAIEDAVIMNAHSVDTDQPIKDIESALTTDDYKALPEVVG